MALSMTAMSEALLVGAQECIMNVMAGTALLERDEPLGRLRGRAEAAADTGGIVLVTGEAGVGKSALVDALAAGTELRVWTGWCERLFTPRPLGAIADIAARAGGALAEVMRSGAPAYEVFPVLLGELASRPTLLVIEDLQWADDATLDVVALLARRVAATRSLAVITARDDEPCTAHPASSAPPSSSRSGTDDTTDHKGPGDNTPSDQAPIAARDFA
jgi:predicted ATPase